MAFTESNIYLYNQMVVVHFCITKHMLLLYVFEVVKVRGGEFFVKIGVSNS
jgi:hypothetical protein